MKLTVVLAIVASILFAVACGGGKDADAPGVAVKAIAPTDTPEPTSTPNTVSSQSPTPPPISMVLETVSPELLSCVQTALGDEQYNAIISGRQDAVAEQVGLVLPCILQYPQEANAIMEMFGLDMGTITAASTPIPTREPTETHIPPPTPTATRIPPPTTTPTATRIPTPTTTPTATRIPTPTPTRAPLLHGIEIVGDERCIDRTEEALEKLSNLAPTHFRGVTTYVGIIECVESGSGMEAYRNPPRYLLGLETLNADLTWLASTIVHDAHHSKLYNDYLSNHPGGSVPAEVWTGRTAEAKCLAVQRDALEKMNAKESTLLYIDKIIETEYWLIPYEDRTW